MDQRLVYSVAQAGQLACFGRTKAYELIKSGQLKTFRLNGRRLVSRQALLDYLASGA
jgi:hypothetical protein